MKVVIDTNIFVSSFFGGNPKKIIDLWKTGQITLCLSKSIIDEYIEVLQRIFHDDQEILQEILELFSRGYNQIFSAKTPHLQIVANDPDDDKFIECAVALKAKYIITGDKALISVKEYMGIMTITPKDFLKLFVE